MSKKRWHSVQIADSSTSVVAGLSHERPHGTIPALEPVHDVDAVAVAVELPEGVVVLVDEDVVLPDGAGTGAEGGGGTVPAVLQQAVALSVQLLVISTPLEHEV